MRKYYFLHEDLIALEKKINELHDKIKELGKDQAMANAQSTENFGHDDGCQESIYQDRRIVLGQLKSLNEILKNSVIIRPEGLCDKVRFGAIVKLSNNQVYRIGSYAIFADHEIQTISYESPVAKQLLGKKQGDVIELRDETLTVISIGSP